MRNHDARFSGLTGDHVQQVQRVQRDVKALLLLRLRAPGAPRPRQPPRRRRAVTPRRAAASGVGRAVSTRRRLRRLREREDGVDTLAEAVRMHRRAAKIGLEHQVPQCREAGRGGRPRVPGTPLEQLKSRPPRRAAAAAVEPPRCSEELQQAGRSQAERAGAEPLELQRRKERQRLRTKKGSGKAAERQVPWKKKGSGKIVGTRAKGSAVTCTSLASTAAVPSWTAGSVESSAPTESSASSVCSASAEPGGARAAKTSCDPNNFVNE